MCGIIGYVGRLQAAPILLEGLKRLEYRGYDSAGIAVLGAGGIEIHRAEGKLSKLEKLLADKAPLGNIGIGHTRWATHGRPSETNAHPHRSGDTVIVHNGIIENHIELRRFLTTEGYEFSSETDTEVICHLIDYYRRESDLMLGAVRQSISRMCGSYSIVVMNAREPDKLYIVKKGAPLVVGESKGEVFVASDIPALLPYTKEMIFLEDGDHGMVSANGFEIYDEVGSSIVRQLQHIPWTPLMAERGGFKHFMLKEIFEQPRVLEDAMAGRLDVASGRIMLGELDPLFDGERPKFDRIVIVACGTSFHAGLVGRYLIESLTRVPVEVDLASEFRYREPLLDERTLVIPISQSGETADTIAAQTLAREMGAKALAVCNVVGSTIARQATVALYTHAGPEIGVASTKAFTAQLVVLHLLALELATRLKMIEPDALAGRINELVKLPRQLKEMLKTAPLIRAIAERISDAPHVLFVGRGANFPVALEGALKLKEISYVHAEGFAAGELKHGPIALIDHGVPVVAIVPHDATYDKVLSNVEEVRTRGASVIALATEGDDIIREKAADVIWLPATSSHVIPILAVLPLQLLAYHVADYKGTDVDQPRNLAKSVTVE